VYDFIFDISRSQFYFELGTKVNYIMYNL